jgi:hypothetical protein
LAPDPGRGEMVDVVAGFDDLTVADAEHEDAGKAECLVGAGDGSLVFKLGDDDLRVGGVVDDDVGGLAVQLKPAGPWREVLT